MSSSPTAPRATTRTKNRRRAAWAILFILTIAVLSAVIIPVRLIMPFSPQSPRGLQLAYTLRHWSPSFTLIAAALAIALVLRLWRGSRWSLSAVLVLALIPMFAATWLASPNHFE